MPRKKAEARRPRPACRLILIPNENADLIVEDDGDFLHATSAHTHQALETLQASFWAGQCALIAVQLEHTGLIPHHLLRSDTTVSRILAKHIIEQAQRRPPEDAGPRVIGPRAHRERRPHFMSDSLLPEDAGPHTPESGVVTPSINPGIWEAVKTLIHRTEERTDRLGIGAIITDPRTLGLIVGKLHDSLEVNERDLGSFVRLDLPPDSSYALGLRHIRRPACR